MAHVLGAALLVGSIVTFDLQVLRRASSAYAVYGTAISVAVTGFVLQIISGIVLLSADAVAVVRTLAGIARSIESAGREVSISE